LAILTGFAQHALMYLLLEKLERYLVRELAP
jgi:hypothetical protein